MYPQIRSILLIIFSVSVYTDAVVQAAGPPQKNVRAILEFIADPKTWKDNLLSPTGLPEESELYRNTELIGALRINSPHAVRVLVEKIDEQVSFASSPSQVYRQSWTAIALTRTGEAAIEPILDTHIKGNGHGFWGLQVFFRRTLPAESSMAILDDYLKQHKELTGDRKEKLKNIRIFCQWQKDDADERRHEGRQAAADWDGDRPKTGEWTLSHPLYKFRQTVIVSNLAILDGSKPMKVFDQKTLQSVRWLGNVRSVEAAETLAPLLLLQKQTKSEGPWGYLTPQKYKALEKHPAAVALAQIGIPSIWAILDEVAKREDGEEYRKLAMQTMAVILPKVALPGFVNETLLKQKSGAAAVRLEKILVLTGDLKELPRKFRSWETTDGLFKASAKFVEIKDDEIVLEKPDGKRTAVPLADLREEDQEYVKELTDGKRSLPSAAAAEIVQ